MHAHAGAGSKHASAHSKVLQWYARLELKARIGTVCALAVTRNKAISTEMLSTVR